MPPAKYEAIKRKLLAEGQRPADAKTPAAKIYNGTRARGEAPVTGHHSSDAMERARYRSKK
jgi:hypothetical protein